MVINLDDNSGPAMQARANINELRVKLNESEMLMNKLADSGFVVKFGFSSDPSGKWKLVTFEVLAPINLDKLRS